MGIFFSKIGSNIYTQSKMLQILLSLEKNEKQMQWMLITLLESFTGIQILRSMRKLENRKKNFLKRNKARIFFLVREQINLEIFNSNL